MELIGTIEDDDELSVVESDDSERQVDHLKDARQARRAKQKSKAKLPEFSDGFSFEVGGCVDDWSNWDLEEAMESVKKPVSTTSTSLATKIAITLKQKQENSQNDDDDDDDVIKGSSENPNADSSGDDDNDDDGSDEGSTDEGSEEEHSIDSDSYFEAAPAIQTTDISFTNMNLSRPLLKAVNSLGFVSPTPIQARTIPIALLGKDICASAATGTGKTAAYMLPVLERLLYRPTHGSTTRVLVLVPTRELAIQVHSVAKVLSKHTKIEICLAAGGLDLKGQEVALRKSPDVIVATPGRLLDHLHNTPSFTLNDLEILILDEADRMLDEHFMDQMNELIRLCPRGRQTMLFSATMTDEVKELVRLSLNQPVKLFVDSNTDTAYNLRQEFVRIRTKHEGDREAIVVALCTRSFHDHCLLFLSTKKDCHRMCIILGLLGLKAVELHGNLTMLQRLEALQQFKEGEANYLVATDLAARGLDIAGVTTVINCTMPATLKQYIHRVGRTARAGKAGRSVTLVGEKERKLLKEIVKQARCPVKSRIVSQEIINKYRVKIAKHEEDINDILKQEKEEKELRVAEMEMNKAHNLIEHHDEIHSRPARVWFTGEDSKKKQPGIIKKQKIKQKNTKKLETDPAVAFAVREAKRSRKQKRLRAIVEDAPEPKRKKKGGKQRSVINTFERELTDTSKKTFKKINSKVINKPKLKAKGGSFKSRKKFKRRK